MRIKSVIFFLLIGGAIIGAAFFAEAIGLDNDPGWGRGRIAILVFGILIIACGIFYYFYADIVLSAFRKTLTLISQNTAGLLKLLRGYWYTFPVFIFVILVYIWFASSGSWTNWVSPTRYYADLANSFKQGKLHLSTRPDSTLLDLPDPYDPLAREHVAFPIDYSLYNGKFYLYWGPVPALLLVTISPFIYGRVGDLYLVFSFVCGIFSCQFLLAITVWDRFFRDLPKWILPLSILMLGLTAPWTYVLINEPNGRVYEAAILGAQFFLMGGFLTAVIAVSKPTPASLTLLLTGSLWALAIGTRLVMVVPIGFMSLMVAYRIWKTSSISPMNFAVKLISLGLPIVLCLVFLGWYNLARFGSVTETGFSYALAGVNLQQHHNDLFSPIYIMQNLYNYILKPPTSSAQFPFLHPKNALLPFYSLPDAYGTNPVTGLLFIAPFSLFAILPAVTLFIKTRRNTSSNSIRKDNSNDLLDWIITSLVGAFFLAFFLLLIFFWAAMRYLGDFMPAIIMVSVFGFWQGYQLLGQRPVNRRIYSIIGIIFAIAGIVISILLSISVKHLGFHGFQGIG